MIAQRLDRVLTAYRIGDPEGRFPIFDATGSKLAPGRWNDASAPVIYASEHYSTAMLEKLVRGGGVLPPNQHYVQITIPNGIDYEVLEPAALPGWDAPGGSASRAYGAAWQKSGRSVLLIVPSVVARIERNFLLNPAHEQFSRTSCGLHHPVWWDRRLFSGAR